MYLDVLNKLTSLCNALSHIPQSVYIVTTERLALVNAADLFIRVYKYNPITLDAKRLH